MTTREATAADLRWLEAKTGCVLTRDARGVVVANAAGPAGVVAFDNWRPNSVEAHVAVTSPLALRRLAPAAADYAFNFAGKALVTGIVRASNTRSVRTALRLGFVIAHRIVDGWQPGVDLCVMEMRREQCRWLSKERKAA